MEGGAMKSELQDIVSGDVINMKYKSDLAPKELRKSKQGFVPRERDPGEAQPWSIDKMAGTHIPQPWPNPRPGADAHMQYKSKGF